jgi:hypothetical protein
VTSDLKDLAILMIVFGSIGIALTVGLGFRWLQGSYARSVARLMSASTVGSGASETSPPAAPTRAHFGPTPSLAAEMALRRRRRTQLVVGFFGFWGAMLAQMYMGVIDRRIQWTLGGLLLATLVFAAFPIGRALLGQALGRVSTFGSWVELATMTLVPAGFVVGLLLMAIYLKVAPPRALVKAMAADHPSAARVGRGLFEIMAAMTGITAGVSIAAIALLLLLDAIRRALRLSASSWSDVVTWWLSAGACSLLFVVSDARQYGPLRCLLWAGLCMAAVPTYVWLMSWARRPEIVPGGLTLAFLRTFDKRSDTLLRDLARDWLEIGRIDLIVGPDVARRPVSSAAPLAWLLGRLRRQFVIDIADLGRGRFAERGRARDGRYELRDLACSAATWRTVVRRLCGAARVVLVDLRGFNARHSGVEYELRALPEIVAGKRIVLVVGGDTDQRYLEDTMRDAGYDRLASHVTILRAGGRRAASREALAATIAAAQAADGGS